MTGRFALDTNAVIALIGGEVSMRNLVTQADEVFIPTPVLGELYFGAYRSERAAENVKRVDDLVQWYAILHGDEATSRLYGLIRHQLMLSGRPIPENDLWIAAMVKQHDAQLVTQDNHFNFVEHLSVVGW